MSTLKNGINMTDLGAYVDAVKSDPSQGQVKFVARSSWGGGANTNVEVSQFYADGKPAAPQGRSFSFNLSEPGALGGDDTAPNPGEMIAAALCGCLTAGIATNAALFDTTLEDIEVSVEVEWDMLGILGLDRSVPSRAKGIHYTVTLSGDDADKLRRAKETLDRKSAILKTLQEAVPVTTDVVIRETASEPSAL
jgi:uncharacterized OsmC-like protein